MNVPEQRAFAEYFEWLVSSGGAQLARAIALWRAGVASEVRFWTSWFETHGLEWPSSYAARMQPAPLASWLVELLPPAQDGTTARVLDVGAGPATGTGTFMADRPVEIVACDPLARIYDQIVERSGVRLPLRTVFSFAEDLSTRFDEESFDVVSCTNALDHAIEPAWGILEMLMVAKPGGYVFLSHRRNEAERGLYDGLHQWNFDAEDGQFIIWNKTRRVNMTALVRGFAEVRCDLIGDGINVRVRKTADVPVPRETYHRRLRAALLDAIIASPEPATPS